MLRPLYEKPTKQQIFEAIVKRPGIRTDELLKFSVNPPVMIRRINEDIERQSFSTKRLVAEKRPHKGKLKNHWFFK